MYYTLRIDADPTSWELTEAIEHVPASSAPVILPVYHPLAGELVLSPRSVGSAVFLEYQVPPIHGTYPSGPRIPKGGALYLPSPIGPDMYSIPPNVYILPDAVDRAALQAEIRAAMTGGTVLKVKVTGGEVVINGATVPFAVLCAPNP